MTSDQQRHLVAYQMCNLPTMMVLAERAAHHNVQLGTQCLLCGSGPEMARHLWECPVQSHEWRSVRQHLHTWPTTYVGPRASQVQGQLWDPAVLEQWPAVIATPSLRMAHMGLAGPHGIGTECIRHILLESQKVRLLQAKAHEGLIKARAGPEGTMGWALRELQLHQQAERQGVPRATTD